MTSTAEPQARKLAETARSAVTMSAGMPWRSISCSAKRSSSSASSPKRARKGATRSSAATSAPERRARIAGQPEVVDVLVGDDEQLDVLDRVPARRERLLELVQRLGGVGSRVDERQRRVLDQVGVDAADLERRGDRQAVDARLGGERQRILVVAHDPVVADERISASTSSRRRSMSSGETSDSRHRRSSGSVLEARTLKCQSS